MKFSIAFFLLMGVYLMAFADENKLPKLSSVGFVSGRAATAEDVKAGNAVFVLRDGENTLSHPIDIKLPQYAYLHDEKGKVPVVVIQAEEAQGQRIMGGIDSSGNPIAGFVTDFELLGNKEP